MRRSAQTSAEREARCDDLRSVHFEVFHGEYQEHYNFYVSDVHDGANRIGTEH
jgi:hypothetical protein